MVNNCDAQEHIFSHRLRLIIRVGLLGAKPLEAESLQIVSHLDIDGLLSTLENRGWPAWG